MYSYGGQFKFNLGYFPNRGGAATRPPRVEIMGSETGIYRSVEELTRNSCPNSGLFRRAPLIDEYFEYSRSKDL